MLDNIKEKIQQYRASFCKKGHGYFSLFFILISPFCAEGVKFNNHYTDDIVGIFLHKVLVFYIIPVLLILIWLDSKRDTRFLNKELSGFILGICLYLSLYYIRIFYHFTESPYVMAVCIIVAFMLGLFLVPIGIMIILISVATMWFTSTFFEMLANTTIIGVFLILPFMPFILFVISLSFYRKIKRQCGNKQLYQYLLMGFAVALVIYGVTDNRTKHHNQEELTYKYRSKSDDQLYASEI